MSTKNKEYQFSVTQVLRNFGSITIEAKTIKEAKRKLKEVGQSSVDWYTEDLVEQMDCSPLKFELESIQ